MKLISDKFFADDTSNLRSFIICPPVVLWALSTLCRELDNATAPL